MNERRKYMRFQAFIDVILKAVNKKKELIRACIKDLSREGVRIGGQHHLKKGSILELEVNIPGDNIPIIATGQVEWTEKLTETDYDSGVRITNIESLDRAKLMDYVYRDWIQTKMNEDNDKREDQNNYV